MVTDKKIQLNMMKQQNVSEKDYGVLLHLENVWKIYQMGEVEVPALKEINVEIEKGDFVAIVGASGSGKSTLMNLIGCLDIPSKGRILLKKQDISRFSESDLASLRGKTIGFIFQQYNLMPTLNAFENVMFPLEFQEVDDRIASQRARKILAFVGLADKIHHLPSQLSGGEQQRVSIARCLVTDPEIILADEPTGALDSITGKKIVEMLHTLWKEEGKTMIMVTHDLDLAKYARTTIELKDGKIIRIQKKEVS
jgi:putative ABC transport system ATP-binding protein